MLNSIITFITLGIACGTMSYTIAKGSIFNWFRDWFFHRSTNGFYNFIHELVSCPYCLSHWVSFVFVCIWRPIITSCGIVGFDLIISWLVIIGIAAIFNKEIGE
jgi:hypothetical protein